MIIVVISVVILILKNPVIKIALQVSESQLEEDYVQHNDILIPHQDNESGGVTSK